MGSINLFLILLYFVSFMEYGKQKFLFTGYNWYTYVAKLMYNKAEGKKKQF